MNRLDCSGCRVQILVCVNERPSPTACCQRAGGLEIYLALKERIREHGLVATHWATRTACLGFCHDAGTTVVIYAAGRPSQWFNQVKLLDLDHLWREIVENTTV